nr:putative fatty acyl-CoA reductase CG5065 [Onthophagus taurus]
MNNSQPEFSASSVADFYTGRTIFVTGGTGFMGKVLLEKLVRSLPCIDTIYILLRPKKGLSVEERVKKLVSSLPFTLNNIDPSHLEKIKPIRGDITKNDFDMSEEDKNKLIEEVSIVFHLAAAIRMDLNLKDAIMANTKSTMQLYNFCMKIKKLISVVHLSTAYCNVEISEMEEKVYPLNLDPYKIIDMVEWMDPKSLAAVEQSLIHPHPNTYTFTKRLAEMIADDMGNKLPIVITRPSIVLPSVFEPAPGWVDSFYGPIGLMVAAGKGVLRTTLLDPDMSPQIIPVDIAINGLIISGYRRATYPFTKTPVYNVTQGDRYQVTWGEVFDYYRNLVSEYPFKKMLWYPAGQPTKNYYLNQIYMLLFQFIPAYIVDFLLILFMQKPFLVMIQNRIYTASNLLQYFTIKKWKFSNGKALEMVNQLSEADKKVFYTDIDVDVKKYMYNTFFGVRKFCVKEDLSNMGYYKFQFKALYFLDVVTKILFLKH